MSDNTKWVDALVGGVILGCFTAGYFLVKAVVLLLVRCWDKYREHRLMRGVVQAWAAATTLALSLLIVPGSAALAGWLAVSTTILAIGALAVSELILDYRVGRSEPADEELRHHLGPW